MRIMVVIWMVMVPLIASLKGQSSTDPYSLDIVSYELKMNSGGRRASRSWSDKRLVQLGDGISVAILKLLGPDELNDPQRVRDFLPLIHKAFLNPHGLPVKANENPNLTLFLLNYLHEKIKDSATKMEIAQTLDYVREKTSK